MTWVRRDDQASIHRKVAPLDDATYRLWSEAIEWCSRNLTDGRVAADELSEIKRGTLPRAARLVERGLWHPAGEECGSEKCPKSGPNGWVIHDYFDYQPTRAKVRADLDAKAERTRKWREAKGKRKPRDAPGDALGDASRDGLVTREYPESVLSPSPSPSPPRREAGIGDPRSANGAGPASPPATVRRKPPDRSPPAEEDPQVIAADQARLVAEAEAAEWSLQAERDRTAGHVAAAKAALNAIRKGAA